MVSFINFKNKNRFLKREFRILRQFYFSSFVCIKTRFGLQILPFSSKTNLFYLDHKVQETTINKNEESKATENTIKKFCDEDLNINMDGK